MIIIETKGVKINVTTITDAELNKLKKDNTELYNKVKKYKDGIMQ